MSERTAQRFVSVAEAYGGKSASLADLGAEAIYELAAPSTPDEVRDAVEVRAAAGEKVSVAEVRRLKRELAETLRASETRARSRSIGRYRL